jgi:hypothetical protein
MRPDAEANGDAARRASRTGQRAVFTSRPLKVWPG